MKTIDKPVQFQLEIQKSKFIAECFQIESEEDIKNRLFQIKQEQKGATHYCYAYILNQQMKASDDGEPSGTAGLPILNVLKRNRLDRILCIVVRYFGGIKLGAGGLVRAYANATNECIQKARIIELVPGYEVKISFPYESLKNVKQALESHTILTKNFYEKVEYIIQVKTDDLDFLKLDFIGESVEITILKEVFIEKDA